MGWLRLRENRHSSLCRERRQADTAVMMQGSSRVWPHAYVGRGKMFNDKKIIMPGSALPPQNGDKIFKSQLRTLLGISGTGRSKSAR